MKRGEDDERRHLPTLPRRLRHNFFTLCVTSSHTIFNARRRRECISGRCTMAKAAMITVQCGDKVTQFTASKRMQHQTTHPTYPFRAKHPHTYAISLVRRGGFGTEASFGNRNEISSVGAFQKFIPRFGGINKKFSRNRADWFKEYRENRVPMLHGKRTFCERKYLALL